MMAWSWKLLIEIAILATMGLTVLWLERYELSRLTEESVKRLRPDQISAISEGAERFHVIVKVLKPLSLATLSALSALLLLTLIKPTDWMRNLGISLAIMYSYVALRRLARVMEARHVRVQRIISRVSTG